MGGIITSSNRGNNIRNLFAGMYKSHGIKYSQLCEQIKKDYFLYVICSNFQKS